MATTFYNQSSTVEDFLKTHRSRLDEDKVRLKAREHDSSSVGILPNDNGRDQTLNQRKDERRNEYQQYLYGKENYAPRRQSESRPTSIADIRQQMQEEREREIMFGDQQLDSEHVSQRRGVVNITEPNPVVDRKWFPVKEAVDDSEGGIGLGRIGYKKEESPEEKKQRQSKYRAELIEQMKRKNKEDPTAIRMGPTRLFRDDDGKGDVRHKVKLHFKHDDDKAGTRHRLQPHFKYEEDEEDVKHGVKPHEYDDSKELRATRRHRPKRPVYSDEEDDYEDVRFNHYHPRPSRYREYPYYPPPPPPPHGPLPPSQYHHSYVPPYYYPNAYPSMYPPPSLQMPHPPPPSNNSYYTDMPNPYMSERYQGPLESRKSIPRVRSPQDYPLKSRYSPILPNKERGWEERGEGCSSAPKETSKAAEFRAILDQQVKEKKERELREKEKVDKLYRRIEAEAEVYDPWGKPGGGAPLTDATGNLVAERGQLRKSFEETSPRMSEEERKKLIQEKTRKELEEQIKENKERQMREKYVKQREDELQEMKILQELKELNMKEKKEIEEEKKKKQNEAMEKRASLVSQPLSAQELAELRFKEDLEKKRMKEEEEKQRLERLAEKMASDSRPSWKQRSSSPPIPTLRNKPSSFQIPAYPTAHPSTQVPMDSSTYVPTHPSTHVPAHPSTHVPAHPSTHVPTHPSTHVPAHSSTHVTAHPSTHVPAHHVPAHPSTHVPAHPSTHDPSTHVPAHPSTYVPAHPSGPPFQVQPPLVQSTRHAPHLVHAPSVSPPVDSSEEGRRKNDQMNHHPSSYGGVPRYTRESAQAPVYQRETSRELMQNFSNLKSQIRNKMATTSATESTRFRNPVPRRNSLSSATLQKFNQLKYTKQSETKFLSEYPDPPRTNTALETQQEALLLHQREDNQQNKRGSESSFLQPRQRPPTGISNFTIATMDIDSLANRNEERAKRLEAILNVNNRGDTQQLNPQSILDEFLRKQCPNPNNKTELN